VASKAGVVDERYSWYEGPPEMGAAWFIKGLLQNLKRLTSQAIKGIPTSRMALQGDLDPEGATEHLRAQRASGVRHPFTQSACARCKGGIYKRCPPGIRRGPGT